MKWSQIALGLGRTLELGRIAHIGFIELGRIWHMQADACNEQGPTYDRSVKRGTPGGLAKAVLRVLAHVEARIQTE
jgi:hypothetical protein